MAENERREGSLDAPTRHPLGWKSADYYDEQALTAELERVYDICHGCRRCVSLCNAFPTLFDLVDESPTMEVDGVAKGDYQKVVDQCYLCDLCYMTKCPYVPPHEWNVDFPHLMLRAKAVQFKKHGATVRDRVLTSTDAVGKLASIPVVAEMVNTTNRMAPARKLMEGALGVHAEAPLPRFHSDTLRKRAARRTPAANLDDTIGLFVTCYGNRNAPQVVEDMIAVFEHNGVAVELVRSEQCCGMPKLELGDLETVERHMQANIPPLLELAERGLRITAPIPSCVLMFRQELPLMFPDDDAVARVRAAMVDPFEFLIARHRAGKFNSDFKDRLGRVAYHVPCHQRVQNIGLKTKDTLELVPDTEVLVIERCSGHDGTYAVKKENYAFAQKICRPVVKRINDGQVDHYISDCPMAGELIEHGVGGGSQASSPFTLLRQAYGI
ncbi:MAG: heterodisulfide reductase-related iron-sulfur binding cluster [Gammaproteobacteria bacterium]